VLAHDGQPAAGDGHPARGWPVDQLAAEVGTLRSVLGQRFSRFIGAAQMSDLAHLRMQMAKRQLHYAKRTVQVISQAVVYHSGASFNRAFRRTLDLPSARGRKRLSVDSTEG
jgi:AraC-like DNA-binding protein